MTKPLFIPLKKEFYEQFKAGTKAVGFIARPGAPIKYQTEFRPYGPRWNERTCRLGRDVVLSCGYGKKNRLHGKIVLFQVGTEPTKTEAWQACYGDKHGLAASIKIEVLGAQP